MFLSSETETSINTQVLDFLSWMTMSGLLAEIFLSVNLNPTRWFSRLYLPHFGVCVHTICWELNDQYFPMNIATLLCRCKYSVDASTLQPALMWLTVSWAFHRLCNCHRSAFLKSYVDGVWYWVSVPELPRSSFQILLWVLYFLTKHNLLLRQQKGFSRLQKIVHALMHWFLPQFFHSLLLYAVL